MTQFQIGRTYSARSACDHNCIFAFTIIARTEKTVTFECPVQWLSEDEEDEEDAPCKSSSPT